MRILILLAAALPMLAQSPVAELNKLYREYYETRIKEYPEEATSLGRFEYNSKWTDYSPAAAERRTAEYKGFLARARRYKTKALPTAERMNHRLFLREMEDRVSRADLINYFDIVNHFFGPHLDITSTLDMAPHSTVKDYEEQIARIEALPNWVDGVIASANEGLKRRLQAPRLTVNLMIESLDSQSKSAAKDSQLLAAFQKMPASIPAAEQQRLRAQAEGAYSKAFQPAWAKLKQYLTTTYAPATRDSIGMSQNFNGAEYYSLYVKSRTTTRLSPQEIHDIGQRELTRILKEMADIRTELKFNGTPGDFVDKVLQQPGMLFHSEEEILTHGRDIAKRIDPELPRLFRKLPRITYGVKAIPADRALTAAPYYEPPALDGSRAGNFFLRTANPTTQSNCCMESLILHEAVPGHHLQIGLAQEMENVPEFRKIGFYGAFVEGWALYAESLGADLGLYETPYERYGRLQQESMRAARLVVDTGMHSLGWTRDRAVETMKPVRGGWITDQIIESEVSRYIAIPAQALSYMVGGLKIRELRTKSEKALGTKFDVREFHDVVLRNGALPLDVLEEEVDSWIASKNAAAAKPPIAKKPA
jgi:prolyl oligopeptidase